MTCAVCGAPLTRAGAHVVSGCRKAGGDICMAHCYEDGGCHYRTDWGCSYNWDGERRKRGELPPVTWVDALPPEPPVSPEAKKYIGRD